MNHPLARGAVSALLPLLLVAGPARAVVPVAPQAVAAVAATPAVKETTGLAKDVAAIPLDVIDVLRLPLGIVQSAVWPGPGDCPSSN